VKEKKKDWKEYLGFEHPRKKGGKKERKKVKRTKAE